MKKNRSLSQGGIIRIVMRCAIAAMLAGLIGCSHDNSSNTESSGISAPVGRTENSSFDPFLPACIIPQRLVLCGVDPQTGAIDNNTNVQCNVYLENELEDPIVGATVKLRWNVSDYPNRSICSTPSGVTFSLSSGVYTLTATTDAGGWAHFRASGGYDGTTSSCSANTATRYGSVIVDNQTLVSNAFVVSAVDLNNTGGLNAADWSAFLAGYNCSGSPYLSRIDFDGSLSINAADYSIFLNIDNAGGSAAHGCE
jgi:hypothetical protein